MRRIENFFRMPFTIVRERRNRCVLTRKFIESFEYVRNEYSQKRHAHHAVTHYRESPPVAAFTFSERRECVSHARMKHGHALTIRRFECVVVEELHARLVTIAREIARIPFPKSFVIGQARARVRCDYCRRHDRTPDVARVNVVNRLVNQPFRQACNLGDAGIIERYFAVPLHPPFAIEVRFTVSN